MRPLAAAWLALATVALRAAASNDLKVRFNNTGKGTLQLIWVDKNRPPGPGRERIIDNLQPGGSIEDTAQVGALYYIRAVPDEPMQRVPAYSAVIVEDGTLGCRYWKQEVRCLFKEDMNYYTLLGVKPDASDKAIKKAYREMSVKYHPDKNPGKKAKQRFKHIRDAYEVLTDTEARICFDQGGMEMVQALKGITGTDQKYTEDMEFTVNFTLAQAYIGEVTELEVERQMVCRGCLYDCGSGVKCKRKECKGCKQCAPDIKIQQFQRGGQIFQARMEQPSTDACRTEVTKLPIRIEKGITQYEIVDFKNMASQKPDHVPGNIQVFLKELPTPPFTRLGSALVMDVEITLREALLGWERSIKHMDGHIVRVSISDITRPGDMIIVKGEGMPIKDVPGDFGDLRLIMSVAFPSALTSSDREELAASSALARDTLKQEL